MMRQSQCLLCGAELQPLDGALGLQRHPESNECLVEYADAWGVSVELVDQAQEPEAQTLDTGLIDLRIFPSVDSVLRELFDEYGLAMLGGASSGHGWSSFSKFQRCPHLWKRTYIDGISKNSMFIASESPALAIASRSTFLGALLHARVRSSRITKLICKGVTIDSGQSQSRIRR
jgi:hypothetical protein